MRGKLLAALGAAAVALGVGATAASAETVWTLRAAGAPAGSQILWLTQVATKQPTLTVAKPGVREQTWNLVSVPGHNITDPQFRIVNRATGYCLGVIGDGSTPYGQFIYPMKCQYADQFMTWQLVIPTPSRTFGPLRLPTATTTQPYLLRNLGSQECLTVPGANFIPDIRIDNTDPCAKYNSAQFWKLSRGEA